MFQDGGALYLNNGLTVTPQVKTKKTAPQNEDHTVWLPSCARRSVRKSVAFIFDIPLGKIHVESSQFFHYLGGASITLQRLKSIHKYSGLFFQ